MGPTIGATVPGNAADENSEGSLGNLDEDFKDFEEEEVIVNQGMKKGESAKPPEIEKLNMTNNS